MMSDFNFKRTFRVDKMTAVRLVDMLQLHRENNRGLPLLPFHPEQALCIALNHFAGGHFQRVSAYCGDVSVAGAHQAIVRVRNKILELKEEYVRLPTAAERTRTAIEIEEKYRLPGFAYAVDGMLVRFDEAPRNIPQAYLCIMNHVY